MNSINDLVNTFTQADFIPDPYGRQRNGVPLSVLRDVGMIYQKFGQLGIPYQWKAVLGGHLLPPSQEYPEGKAFFIGNLSVFINGVEHTVPGSSETPKGTKVGLAGCETLAIQNAALRGLRMAEWLYVNDKVQDSKQPVATSGYMQSIGPISPVNAPQPPSAPIKQVVTQPPTPPQGNGAFIPQQQSALAQAPAPARTNRFGGPKPNYTPGQPAGMQRQYKPWDGTATFKSGPFIGKEYRDPAVPIDYLQKLAGFTPPLATAVKELERRMEASGAPSLSLQEQY